ncbi:class I SAM-dependent methyltransferase [Euzebya tangerina]|uniref:class I SAM-dependent methyltransferase n=1 Tax=Euzebya tangerina TaxID=591198 RepID=UPI000E322830|nr:methyltransferase domain-containing protein [Euzebya tangerina]
MSWETLTAAEQDHLLRRPFDHFARYRLAAEVVERTVGPDARVLDLGGGPGTLAAFLPEADVTATDIVAPSSWHEQAPDLVLADGAQLPFADDAFDAVVTLDTLEHVVPASRSSFLDEIGRVAARWALVVCPFGTPGVPDADIALRAYVRNRFADDLPTIGILNEHINYGHPNLAASRDRLAAFGLVATIPSGRLDRWLAGMITFFHLLSLGDDEPVEVVQRFLNRNLYEADLQGPAYRHGLLLRLTDDGPDPQSIADALLERAIADPHAEADLDLLRLVLTEELIDSSASQADLQARLDLTAEAERQTRKNAEGLEQALAVAEAERVNLAAQIQEVQAQRDALQADLDRIMQHPAVRVRRAVKRLLDR